MPLTSISTKSSRLPSKGIPSSIKRQERPWTSPQIRPVYDELTRIPEAINNGNMLDKEGMVSFVSPYIRFLGKKTMKKFYIFMGHQGWKQSARKKM